MRRLELEFLHRLIVEPRRWRRQLALPRFALLAAVAAARVRLAGPSRRAV
jgi:N-acetylglucosaminyldiphosphoundecaprenol N-acetyl-beta-D-mannosaminyltransferase